MEQQGFVNCFHERHCNLSLFSFFAVLFLICLESWGSCQQTIFSILCSGGKASCAGNCPTNLAGFTVQGEVSGVGPGCGGVEGTVSFTCTGGNEGAFVKSTRYVRNCYGSDYSARGEFTVVYCTDPCEAQREYCISQGLDYDADSCKCKMPCPESVCDDMRSFCEGELMGDFSGRCIWAGGATQPCCSGYCNVCGGSAMKENQRLMKDACCRQLKAPPTLQDVCYQNSPLGDRCGMVQSTFRTNGENWACHDPNQSSEMMNRYYQECYNSSSSAAGSSSGGTSSGAYSSGGTSSGAGGSSGNSDYPEGCDECPYLDSILDTLTLQKHLIGDIYACVVYPSLCSSDQSSENSSFQFDTAWYNYVRPYLDTSLRLDSLQLEALKRLDTNQLKLLESNIEQLRNDTLIRLVVSGGFSQTQDAISQTRGSIVHLNDTTRKWLDRISSKIGFTTDSLISHIDSIRKDIPVHVLDSILKYQKQLAEKEDSLVLGDLPSIDSLIDSTVRYWRMSMEKDSLRRLESNDSLFALHDAIDAVALRMSYLLGYGDTASSDLRNDLFSMNDTIKAHFDSIAARLGISTDSLIAHIDGLNLSSIDSLRVDLNGFSESFITYRDSALKYFGLFGDSMSAINGALGELIAKFSPGAIDTNGLGVWASYMRSGENMGDSIVRSYGWQNLKNLNVDSNYSAALAGFPNKTDSVSAVVDDSLSNRAARLNDSLVRKNDSLKRSLPDTLTKYADSLIIWAPFADFDSIIYSTIGTRIPNRDDCPEDCQSWSVSIPVIGLVNYTVDYGLCLGRASLGNLSVLAFLKLLIRIIVAITCVMIIYRTLVAIK